MKYFPWLAGFLLSSCAITTTEGMLASVTKPRVLDSAFLERQCDVEDRAACYFLRGRLPELSRVPIVQGVAPADRAVFTVLAGPLAEHHYYLRQKEAQTLSALPVAKVYRRESSGWRLERIELNALETGKSYELLVADRSGQLLDIRSFRPLKESPEAFRFALVAGLHQPPAPEEEELWRSLLDREPRLILALGNLLPPAGSGSLSPEALWERYAESRAAQGLFRQPTLVPIAATWNAPDMGAPEERAGRDHPHVDAARAIQEAFFPLVGDAQTVAEGPGVAKAVRVANQTFLLMDARSFREGNEAYFGRVQETWALRSAESAPGPLWFLSGEPWFTAAYPRPSFEKSHPAAFREFCAGLEESMKKPGRGPFFFGSAGPFFSEAQTRRPFSKAKYETVEFSAGPFSPGDPTALLAPPAPASGSYRSQMARYLLVTTWPKGDGLTLHAEAVEPGNRAGFSLRFEGKPPKPSPAKARAKRRR